MRSVRLGTAAWHSMNLSIWARTLRWTIRRPSGLPGRTVCFVSPLRTRVVKRIHNNQSLFCNNICSYPENDYDHSVQDYNNDKNIRTCYVLLDFDHSIHDTYSMLDETFEKPELTIFAVLLTHLHSIRCVLFYNKEHEITDNY